MKLSLVLFRVKVLLRYFLYARHAKGFGIHSPFVFYFVRELVYEQLPYYGFNKVNAARDMLRRSKRKVNVQSYGAPSVNPAKEKYIKNLIQEGSIPAKYGELLFRMIDWQAFENILELGTGTGIGTLYLALPDSRARVTTIEGNKALCRVAGQVFESAGATNIKVLNGKIQEVLPSFLEQTEKVDFVLFDGDHQYQTTLEYFELCLKKSHNDTIFVFDDIHWSPGMEKAWDEIAGRPDVTVSIDLFRMGIVFFRKECTKQHYVLRY